jgi:hypothetical protein
MHPGLKNDHSIITLIRHPPGKTPGIDEGFQGRHDVYACPVSHFSGQGKQLFTLSL